MRIPILRDAAKRPLLRMRRDLMVRASRSDASRTMEPGAILRDAAKRPLLRMRK
jgi:hypothetical protein